VTDLVASRHGTSKNTNFEIFVLFVSFVVHILKAIGHQHGPINTFGAVLRQHERFILS